MRALIPLFGFLVAVAVVFAAIALVQVAANWPRRPRSIVPPAPVVNQPRLAESNAVWADYYRRLAEQDRAAGRHDRAEQAESLSDTYRMLDGLNESS